MDDHFKAKCLKAFLWLMIYNTSLPALTSLWQWNWDSNRDSSTATPEVPIETGHGTLRINRHHLCSTFPSYMTTRWDREHTGDQTTITTTQGLLSERLFQQIPWDISLIKLRWLPGKESSIRPKDIKSLYLLDVYIAKVEQMGRWLGSISHDHFREKGRFTLFTVLYNLFTRGHMKHHSVCYKLLSVLLTYTVGLLTCRG